MFHETCSKKSPEKSYKKISQTALTILHHLRCNSRQSLSAISRKTGIPVTTVFDNVKALDMTLVRKHFSLVDYKLLNVTRIFYAISCSDKKPLRKFLKSCPNVNNAFRTRGKADFIVESVFRTFAEADLFYANLLRFGSYRILECAIEEELIRENVETFKEHSDQS